MERVTCTLRSAHHAVAFEWAVLCGPLTGAFGVSFTRDSVDLTCHSIEQMTFLIKGFHAIVAQCKKKRRL